MGPAKHSFACSGASPRGGGSGGRRTEGHSFRIQRRPEQAAADAALYGRAADLSSTAPRSAVDQISGAGCRGAVNSAGRSACADAEPEGELRGFELRRRLHRRPMRRRMAARYEWRRRAEPLHRGSQRRDRHLQQDRHASGLVHGKQFVGERGGAALHRQQSGRSGRAL